MLHNSKRKAHFSGALSRIQMTSQGILSNEPEGEWIPKGTVHFPQTIYLCLKEHLPLVLLEEIMLFLPVYVNENPWRFHPHIGQEQGMFGFYSDCIAYIVSSLATIGMYNLVLYSPMNQKHHWISLVWNTSKSPKSGENPEWQILCAPSEVMVIGYVQGAQQSQVWNYRRTQDWYPWDLIQTKIFPGKVYGYRPVPREFLNIYFVLRTSEDWWYFHSDKWNLPIVRSKEWTQTAPPSSKKPKYSPVKWWLPEQHIYAPPRLEWDPSLCPFSGDWTKPPSSIPNASLIHVLNPNTGLGITKSQTTEKTCRYYVTKPNGIRMECPEDWQWMFPSPNGECIFRSHTKPGSIQWFAVDPLCASHRSIPCPDLLPNGKTHPLWTLTQYPVSGCYVAGAGFAFHTDEGTWFYKE